MRGGLVRGQHAVGTPPPWLPRTLQQAGDEWVQALGQHLVPFAARVQRVGHQPRVESGAAGRQEARPAVQKVHAARLRARKRPAAGGWQAAKVSSSVWWGPPSSTWGSSGAWASTWRHRLTRPHLSRALMAAMAGVKTEGQRKSPCPTGTPSPLPVPRGSRPSSTTWLRGSSSRSSRTAS